MVQVIIFDKCGDSNACGAFVDIRDSGLSIPYSQKSLRNTPTLKHVGLIILCSEGADWDCSLRECDEDLL